MNDDALDAVNKLKDWIRENMPGCCRMYSQGSSCTCLLCCVDRLMERSAESAKVDDHNIDEALSAADRVVGRLLERNAILMEEVGKLHLALLPFAMAASRPGTRLAMEPLRDDELLPLCVRVGAWKRAMELTGMPSTNKLYHGDRVGEDDAGSDDPARKLTYGCNNCGKERVPRVVAGCLTCPECGSVNVVCIDKKTASHDWCANPNCEICNRRYAAEKQSYDDLAASGGIVDAP